MEKNESKKILIISDAWKPQVNGVVRTYEYIAEELTRAGHDVRVIGPHDFPRRLKMPGYNEIELALSPYRRLRRIIDDFAPDYLHVATEGPLGWAARRYCRAHGMSYTTAYHTHFPDYVAKRLGKHIPVLQPLIRRQMIKFVREFHAEGHGLMVATPSLEDELLSWEFKTPMYRLLRGVHVDLFRPHDGEEPRLFDDLPRPVALYVGRVALEKNLESFLAMDWAGSKIIVGDGPSREMLEKKYPEAHFVGKKEGEELAAHYRSSDIFVFPSKTDTFGIVLIEALASGLPVAAHDVTGPRDIVTADYLGHLHEDLALAARTALAHSDKAHDRHLHVRETYTWPVVAQQFLDILYEAGEARKKKMRRQRLLKLLRLRRS